MEAVCLEPKKPPLTLFLMFYVSIYVRLIYDVTTSNALVSNFGVFFSLG